MGTTSSLLASSPILASALDAPSATTLLPTMASRIARPHACSAGASQDASPAPSLLRTTWHPALASPQLLQLHAWTFSSRCFLLVQLFLSDALTDVLFIATFAMFDGCP